jgi:hypothetical protein
MSEKGQYAPFVRRIITVALFIGITGALMGLYYLVYLPQQQAQFNQRTFRILAEISNNFSQRVANYGTAYSNRFISKIFPDSPFMLQTVKSLRGDDLNNAFKNTFKGDVARINDFKISQRNDSDSIVYTIKKDSEVIEASRTFGDILEPLIAIHSNTFESVILVKQKAEIQKSGNTSDSILYRSKGANITKISIDSLMTKKSLVVSTVRDVEIEGVKYKLFLYPFTVTAISEGTFILSGLISQKDYQQQSQASPVSFLFAFGFLLVLLLLALPFLKIYVLSIQENITIADVRLIIAVVFIIPFVITLFTSALWLYKYPEQFSTEVLSSIQENVKRNLYREINQTIRQAQAYDTLIGHVAADSALVDSLRNSSGTREQELRKVDLKDIFFYPKVYNNIDNVHWMDAAGNDIAAWNFINQPPGYFPLKDRDYYRDIIYKRGYVIPGTTDTFSILPTLSRLTGEYTINIGLRSRMALGEKKKAAVVSISTKMYSLYNTVVPPGFAFSIVDENGEILSHSDTARNLQENIFEETGDNHYLHVAINHKDSTVIDDIDMYEHPVKMMVKPMEGLPYYLVTYFDKRGQYLFIIHILAFVFVCESIILLFVSLFSYSLMMAGKKLSKLFFIPAVLYWLKPSASKTEYYIKNSIQLLLTILIVFLFAGTFGASEYYLYMLNASLLLPLFAVSNYYIIKRGKNFREEYERNKGQLNSLLLPPNQFLQFIWYIRVIVILYILSLLIFAILQHVILFKEDCTNYTQVEATIWILACIMPLISLVLAAMDGSVFISRWRAATVKYLPFGNWKNKVESGETISPDSDAQHLSKPNDRYKYLSYFVTSVLLSVSVISVIPSITFTGYALHEERKLHFQTLQLKMAKKIQVRRTEINKKLWQTKVLQSRQTGQKYIDSLKFSPDKGLYLFPNVLDTAAFAPNAASYTYCSPFYKLLTQFLFLPPDHDEFYDNPTHNRFYYWRESFDTNSFDSLSLSYANQTDYRNPASFQLKGGVPRFYVFKDITKNPLGNLVVLALLIFIFLFHKIVYSIAKRVFLVGYFDSSVIDPEGQQGTDKPWLKEKYTYKKIEDLCKPIFPIHTPTTFAGLRERENEVLVAENGDEVILKLHLALLPQYEKIWKDCSNTEKFTLYDFALDGFTNYKKLILLNQLYDKGLLIKEDDNLALMTHSFRNFLITKETAPEIKAQHAEGKGSWAVMRTVFYIILAAVAIFIFISQEEASKRLITVVTSVGALLPVILKLFDKSTFTSNTKTNS